MTIDQLIEDEAFGDIFMVEVDYLHRIWMTTDLKWYGSREISGTALLTAGCHAVDALRWFARSEVEEVSAYQVKTDNPAEYPGTISINVKFKDGKIGRSTTTFDAKMPYRFNIGIYGINDEQPFPDIEDAALTHAVCFAADLSAESGRPVSVSEFDNLL